MSKFDIAAVHKVIFGEFVKMGAEVGLADTLATDFANRAKEIAELWFGDDSVTPVEFDGIEKIIASPAASAEIIKSLNIDFKPNGVVDISYDAHIVEDLS